MCVYSLFYDEMLHIVNIYYCTNRKLVKLQVFKTVYSILCTIKYSLFRLLNTSNCNSITSTVSLSLKFSSLPFKKNLMRFDTYRTRTDTFHRKIYTEKYYKV